MGFAPTGGTREAFAAGVGEVLVWGTVAWAVFAIGATTGTGVVVLWGLASLSCLVNTLVGQFRADEGVRLLAALAVWTLFQSAPLPLSAVALFDDDIAQTWSTTLGLLGEAKYGSLSLQPLTTRLEAMKLWAYAATWGCLVGLATKRGADVTVARVVWLVVAVVGVTLLHRALGWDRVYAWYEPQHVQPYWVGPLLNVNNLGGLCNLGVFAALACTFRSAAPDRRWWVFVTVALLLCGMTLLTGSRGAVVALCAGTVVFAAQLWRHRRSVSVRHFGVVIVALVGLVLSVLLLDEERLFNNLGDRSFEKLKLLKWALKLIQEHGFWGVGRGALQAEIPTVQPEVGQLLIPFVECFPLDWATGWGVPIAVVVLALTLGALVQQKGGLRTNALRLALGVVLLQNLFDLGLEVPGLTLPWLCVFAVFRRPGREVRFSRTRAIPILGLAVFIVAVSSFGFPRRTAAETRWELSRLYPASNGPAFDSLQHALLTNPGDHALLRATALHAAARQDSKTLAWINAALLRAPNSALTHLTLGQVLWQQGARKQATGALRRAAEDETLHDVLDTWLSARDPNLMLDVAPSGQRGADFLRKAAVHHTNADVQRKLLEGAVERSPEDVAVRLDYLEWWVGSIVRGQDHWCSPGDGCVSKLESELQSVMAASAQLRGDLAMRLALLKVRVRSLRGDPQGALAELEPICQPDDLRCAQVALELARHVGGEKFDEAADRYLETFCARSERCVTERIEMAGTLASAGRWLAAHRHYVISAGFGTDPRAFAGASEMAERLGREHEALHWLTKGEQRFGANPFAAQRRRLGLPSLADPPKSEPKATSIDTTVPGTAPRESGQPPTE